MSGRNEDLAALNEIVKIWKREAPRERFGQFLFNCLRHEGKDVDPWLWSSMLVDMLGAAKRRFNISE